MATQEKTIMFICPLFPPRYSGATLQAITLADALAQNGWNITFLVLAEDDERLTHSRSTFRSAGRSYQVERLYVTNIDRIVGGYCGLATHLKVILKLFFKLFLLRRTYSCIHCHTLSFPFSSVGLFGRLFRKRTIGKISMADEILFSQVGRITGHVHKYFVSCFDHSVAISKEIADDCRNHETLSHKVAEITNGVDCRRFHPVDEFHKDELKRKLALPPHKIVLFVGGLIKRKGADFLVETWLQSEKLRYMSVLVLVGPYNVGGDVLGEQSSYEIIQENIAAYQADQRVIITGKVDNVHEYLQVADVLVLPSQKEGMPNVVLEAMACGVPVVAFDGSGVNGVVEDTASGEIVRGGDRIGLQKAIERICSDDDLQNKYSMRSREIIQERFAADEIAQKYHLLYLGKLDSKRQNKQGH